MSKKNKYMKGLPPNPVTRKAAWRKYRKDTIAEEKAFALDHEDVYQMNEGGTWSETYPGSNKFIKEGMEDSMKRKKKAMKEGAMIPEQMNMDMNSQPGQMFYYKMANGGPINDWPPKGKYSINQIAPQEQELGPSTKSNIEKNKQESGFITIKDSVYNERNNRKVPLKVINYINHLAKLGNLDEKQKLLLHSIALNESEHGATKPYIFGEIDFQKDSFTPDTGDRSQDLIEFIKNKTDNFTSWNKYNPHPEYPKRIEKMQQIIQANPDFINAINNDLPEYGWGGAGTGALSGAATGAAIGSVVPVYGTIIGAAVGAIGGGIIGHLKEEEQQQKQHEQERIARMNASSQQSGYMDNMKRFEVARLFANGGALGSIQEYTGDTHQDASGGIPVDAQGNPSAASGYEAVAKVEDGEVSWNKFIFSNRKELVGKRKPTYADRAKSIINKYSKYKISGDPIAKREMDGALGSLAQEQEDVKKQLGIGQNVEQQPQMATGGYIDPFDINSAKQYFAQRSGYSRNKIMSELQDNLNTGVLDDQTYNNMMEYFSKNYGYTPSVGKVESFAPKSNIELQQDAVNRLSSIYKPLDKRPQYIKSTFQPTYDDDNSSYDFTKEPSMMEAVPTDQQTIGQQGTPSTNIVRNGTTYKLPTPATQSQQQPVSNFWGKGQGADMFSNQFSTPGTTPVSGDRVYPTYTPSPDSGRYSGPGGTNKVGLTKEEVKTQRKENFRENTGLYIMGLSAAADFGRYFLQKPQHLDANSYMVNPNNLVAPIYTGEGMKRDLEGQIGANRYLLAGQSPTLRYAGINALANQGAQGMANIDEQMLNLNKQTWLGVESAKTDIASRNAQMRFAVDDWNAQSDAAHEALLDSGISKLEGLGVLATQKALNKRTIENNRYIDTEKSTDEVSPYITDNKSGEAATNPIQVVPTTTTDNSGTNNTGGLNPNPQYVRKNTTQEMGNTRVPREYFDFSPTIAQAMDPSELDILDNNRNLVDTRDANVVQADEFEGGRTDDYRDPSKFNNYKNLQDIPTYDGWLKNNSLNHNEANFRTYLNNEMYPAAMETAKYYGLRPAAFMKQLSQEFGGEGAYETFLGGGTRVDRDKDGVPDSSAKGMGQFIDATAKEFGVNTKDPLSSMDGMARYMKWNLAKVQAAAGGKQPHQAFGSLGYHSGYTKAIEIMNTIGSINVDSPEAPDLIRAELLKDAARTSGKKKERLLEAANYIASIYGIKKQ